MTVKKIMTILLRAIGVILIFLVIFFYTFYDSLHASFAESSKYFFTKNKQYMGLVNKITNSELLSDAIENRISISLSAPESISSYFVDGKECKSPTCESGLLQVSNDLKSLLLEYDLDGLSLMNDKIIVQDHGETFFGYKENYTFTYYFTGVDEYHIIPNMSSDYTYSIRKRIDGNRYYVDELRK